MKFLLEDRDINDDSAMMIERLELVILLISRLMTELFLLCTLVSRSVKMEKRTTFQTEISTIKNPSKRNFVEQHFKKELTQFAIE